MGAQPLGLDALRPGRANGSEIRPQVRAHGLGKDGRQTPPPPPAAHSAPAAMAAARMAGVLPHKGSTGLEIILLVVFAILFAWISVGFWTAMAGFAVLLRRHDRFLITGEHLADSPVRQGVRTAVVFPVYGEDMARVTAGIEAVHRSMDRAGGTADFDFYILSDTRDPEAWAEEEAAWADLKARLAGNSRIFYRAAE